MKTYGSRIILSIDDSSKGSVEKIGMLQISTNNEKEVGIVVSVGREIEEKEDLKPGDKVYIYYGSGKEFHHEGKLYRVVTLNEVIAKI